MLLACLCVKPYVQDRDMYNLEGTWYHEPSRDQTMNVTSSYYCFTFLMLGENTI